MEEWCAFFGCFLDRDDRFERLVIDFYPFQCILGQVTGGCDYCGDWFSDESRLLHGHRIVFDRERWSRSHRISHLLDLLPGDHRQNSGLFEGARSFNPLYLRMRVRAPKNRNKMHSRDLDVIDESPLSSEEPDIFLSLEPLTYPFLRNHHSLGFRS